MTRKNFYFLLLLSLPFGVLNLHLGQSVDYDLMLYHFYNPFSLFNGRFNIDIDPAHMQTYMNPLADIPFYFFNKSLGLHASVFGFIQGAFQGLTCFFYFKIFDLLTDFFADHSLIQMNDNSYVAKNRLSSHTLRWRTAFCVVAATLSTCSPLFLDLLGTTFNDSTASLFWLAAFYMLLSREKGSIRILWAGIFAGLGSGLKITGLIFLIPTFLFIPIVLKFQLRSSLQLCFGIVSGFFLSAGWWALLLYKRFGNPLFPLYSGLFPNRFMNAINFSPRDANMYFEDWHDFFKVPFYLLNNKNPVVHLYQPFADARLLVMLGLAVVTLSILIFKSESRRSKLISPFVIFVSGFWLISYCLWFKTSMVLRYFVIGDQLIPVITFGLLAFLLSSFKFRVKFQPIIIFTFLMTILFIFQKTPQSGARYAWQSEFFRIQDKPALSQYGQAMILMPARDNISYVIPYFPASSHFVRVQGSLDFFNMSSEEYVQNIWSKVQSFKGSLYSMQLTYPGGKLNYPEQVMIQSELTIAKTVDSIEKLYALHGLKLTSDCHNIETIIHQFNDLVICRLERVTSNAGP